MTKLRANEVFKPGSFPSLTYVSRKSEGFPFTYEMRLMQALSTPGYLTSIVGPSKIGKTVLCEKVIGAGRMVSLTGGDFRGADDFWHVIANKVGVSLEGEYSKTSSYQGTSFNPEEKSVSTREVYRSSKDKVIQYFKEQDLTLIIDDFHYAPEQLQFDIAYQLKDAIRSEFKAVVISLPHRADDAIRRNPDLSGRLNLITIEPWKDEELEAIAVRGFTELGAKISKELSLQMAAESLTSPQLMQSICLNLSIILDIDHQAVRRIDDLDKLKESYRFTTINLPYQEVMKKLAAGPSTRGQRRKQYELDNGEKADVFRILLQAIALDPPVTTITLDEIKERVDLVTRCSKEKIERNKVKDSLRKVEEIMQSSNPIYQVFEWKDDQLFILDPLFLFYLRWNG